MHLFRFLKFRDQQSGVGCRTLKYVLTGALALPVMVVNIEQN